MENRLIFIVIRAKYYLRDLFLSALQWKVKVLSNRRVPGNDPSVLVNLRIAVVFNIPPGNRLGRGVIAKTNVRKVSSLPHFLHILPHICILPLLIEKLTLSFSSRNYAKGPTFLSFELKHCVYRPFYHKYGGGVLIYYRFVEAKKHDGFFFKKLITYLNF